MSVANVTMFEFENEDSIKKFASWYKGHGSYPDNEVSLFVKTGETTAMGISVYPTEEARSRADRLREESADTSLKNIVKEIVPLSGDVLVHFLNGELVN
jgi:hypothetical protein